MLYEFQFVEKETDGLVGPFIRADLGARFAELLAAFEQPIAVGCDPIERGKPAPGSGGK